MDLATSPGAGFGRLLRVLVAIAVAAAVLMVIPPAQGEAVDGTIGFSSPTSNALEGTSTHTVNVVLSVGDGNTLSGAVTLSVTASPITATTPADFSLVTTQVTFSAGDDDATPPVPVAINIENDTIFEGNETLSLELEVVSGTATLGQSTHTVTIVDNDSQPTLSVNSPPAVVEGGVMGFTVTMSNGSSSPVTVDYETVNGSAVAPGDFTAVSGTLTFNPGGSLTQTVNVTTNNDSLFEATESFSLVLSSPVGATLGTAVGTGTITDNDSQPTLSVNSPPAVVEGGVIGFTVTMSNGSSSPVTVDYETVNGSAVAPGDFTAVSGTVTFNPGTGLTRTVNVQTINDSIYEGPTPETFTLTLSDPTNATISNPTGTGTITDNDSQPTMSVDSPAEQEEGEVIEFTVTMSNLSAFPVSVNYATANGTAVAGSDYTAVSGALTFNPGTGLTRTVDVPTVNDTLFEATETFTLVLSGASGATISNATGTGTILDNDGPPGISALDATANEGDGVIQFTVVLLPAAGQPVKVDWATADGTATSPADYLADSGSLTFAPGETSKIVEVTITDDDDDGVDKTFSLVLSNQIPPNTSVVDAIAIGTIVDDDNVAPTINVMKTVDSAGLDRFAFAPGQTVRLTGTFTDPGVGDSHTVTINWGDGSPATILPLTPVGTRTFQAAHTYGAAKLYPISMTVRDEDGGVSDVKQVFVVIEGASVSPGHTVALVDTTQGRWFLYDDAGNRLTDFYFGNPGDIPFMGDWNGNGIETPGLYRQSDGFVYLRNTNTEGSADIRFFFGDPGDVPIAGDFNGDGRDTLSIYRPSNQTFYIINELGKDEGGLGAADLSYVFGDPGDKPFVGDFNGNGVETVGLHRESTGFVYFRNTHTQGNADAFFFFGDPGDRLIAGDWNDNGVFSPALFRPSNATMYFRWSNTQGNADNEFVPNPVSSAWVPVSGRTN